MDMNYLAVFILIALAVYISHLRSKYDDAKRMQTYLYNAIFLADRPDTKILSRKRDGRYYVVYQCNDFEHLVCEFFDTDKEKYKRLMSFKDGRNGKLLEEGVLYDYQLLTDPPENININQDRLYCEYKW